LNGIYRGGKRLFPTVDYPVEVENKCAGSQIEFFPFVVYLSILARLRLCSQRCTIIS
jgi:hypothetical protein